MRKEIVLTLTGADRVGLVEEVTGVLLGLGGNVETSRMARLGGEFAMLALVSLPADQLAAVDGALAHLGTQGCRLAVVQTQEAATTPGWFPYEVRVSGADHEGIIHDIAAGLSRAGINIESMETSTSSAPVSGAPLFEMSATVAVPPGLSEAEWTSALIEAAQRANVDVEITAEGGS